MLAGPQLCFQSTCVSENDTFKKKIQEISGTHYTQICVEEGQRVSVGLWVLKGEWKALDSPEFTSP